MSIIRIDLAVTCTHHHIAGSLYPNLTFELKNFENYPVTFHWNIIDLIPLFKLNKMICKKVISILYMSVNIGLFPASRFYMLSYGGHLWFVDCGHKGADINCLSADLKSQYSNYSNTQSYSRRDRKLYKTEVDLSYILRSSVSAKNAKVARAITQSWTDVRSWNFQDIFKMFKLSFFVLWDI